MKFEQTLAKIMEGMPVTTPQAPNTPNAQNNGQPATATAPAQQNPTANAVNPNPGANQTVNPLTQKVMAAFNDPKTDFNTFAQTPEGKALTAALASIK